MAYLDPLVDASSLKTEAAKQAIAPEWAEAVAQKRVMEGMDKNAVVAILGEPREKHVDVSVEPPTEKWVYEADTLKTVVITFREGKVVKLVEL
jgi:hypothetical protein